MKTPDFRQIDFTIPAHWSPEEALAVFELLDDLRDKIWAHYRLRLQQLLAEQQQAAPRTSRMRYAIPSIWMWISSSLLLARPGAAASR